ncbi:MAG: FeoA family protein [Clostridia bacterium]|nr:FeoA family protein [Clostridia bacterium]
MKRLSDLGPGESGRVRCVTASGRMKRRLMDLGLTEGAEAVCLFFAPGKGMRAYRIRKTVAALRRRDAESIILEDGCHE